MPTEVNSPANNIDAKVAEILDQLDLKAGNPAANQARKVWRYRRSNMTLLIEHPAGGVARTTGHARSLWREGVSVLSASFCYPGSKCTVVLVSNEGDLLSVRGTVEACRHVQGGYHELTLRFSQCVDPQMFVEVSSSGGAGAEQVDPANLRAVIVHLDDSDADTRLMSHYLRGSGITLRSCRTPADALAALNESVLADIFLCDLNLGHGIDSLPTIRAAREANFVGPIVLLTAENHPSKIAAAKEAGADTVLNKPFTREALMAIIVRLHHQVGAIAGDSLYSSLADHPGSEELITSYIDEMKEMANLLSATIRANDLNAVRDLCLHVKGTAAGYGFSPLGAAAEDAVKSLDATMGIDEARPKLRSLSLMTSRLTLRPRQTLPTSQEKERYV